jgi:hypothetical protein
MMLRIPLLCTTTLVLVALMQAESPQQKDLTRADLLAEYKGLIPINQAMHRGEWPVQNEHYPKTLGTFDSREVQEAFWCGDLCPQYGSVNIIYSNVKEQDCAAIGQPLYSHFWGTRYQGCTPLIGRVGKLVQKGSSWAIAYSTGDGTKPPIEEPLLFDDLSRCNKGTKKISCGELHEGREASVEATRSGAYLWVAEVNEL